MIFIHNYSLDIGILKVQATFIVQMIPRKGFNIEIMVQTIRANKGISKHFLFLSNNRNYTYTIKTQVLADGTLSTSPYAHLVERHSLIGSNNIQIT